MHVASLGLYGITNRANGVQDTAFHMLRIVAAISTMFNVPLKLE